VVPAEPRAGEDDPEQLRYQAAPRHTARSHGEELMYVKLRYKLPDASSSRLLDHVVTRPDRHRPSADFRFAAAVAAFGMILRDSEHRGHATLDGVLELARESLGHDEMGYRAEFVKLVEHVRSRDLVAARNR
jgi:Ca-activated chloride channel family protein